MAIYINNKNRVSKLFINVNGEKKNIISAWTNRNGTPTKIFQTTEGSRVVSWADATYEELTTLLTQHYNGEINLADHWNVGDERVIHLSAMDNWNTTYGESQPEQDVTLIILGFNVDTLRDSINGISKAAMTVQLKNCLSNKGIIDADYVTCESNYKSCTLEWAACDRRNWCNTTFKNSLPVELRNLIKLVGKTDRELVLSGSPSKGTWSLNSSNTSSPGICNDSCFFLNKWELGFKTNNIDSSNEVVYPYYQLGGDKTKNFTRWWLRDPYCNGTENITTIGWEDMYVTVYGAQFMKNKAGIAPAFCL